MNTIMLYILPIIGKPLHEYPKMRDCWYGDHRKPNTKNKIVVHCKIGGINRQYNNHEINVLRSTPGYMFDYDDSSKDSYANFVFNIPYIYREDVALVLQDRLVDISTRYKELLLSVYPDKKHLQQLFGNRHVNSVS